MHDPIDVLRELEFDIRYVTKCTITLHEMCENWDTTQHYVGAIEQLVGNEVSPFFTPTDFLHARYTYFYLVQHYLHLNKVGMAGEVDGSKAIQYASDMSTIFCQQHKTSLSEMELVDNTAAKDSSTSIKVESKSPKVKPPRSESRLAKASVLYQQLLPQRDDYPDDSQFRKYVVGQIVEQLSIKAVTANSYYSTIAKRCTISSV